MITWSRSDAHAQSPVHVVQDHNVTQYTRTSAFRKKHAPRVKQVQVATVHTNNDYSTCYSIFRADF